MPRNTHQLNPATTFFLIIGLLVLPSLAHADDFTLSGYTPLDTHLDRNMRSYLTGYTEVGKRSTAEDYEEEDTDDDYIYHNYHLKFEQEVSSRISYDLSSFIYDKDYKSRDSLDNLSRLFKTNWSYYIRKFKEESLRIDFKLKYKEKRYDNSPRSEYDQIRVTPAFTFKKKDIWTVDLTFGIDNYDYLDAGENDQLKIFGKIGIDRYFLGNKLMLTSAYKIETLEEKIINRKRTKHEGLGGFDYLFSLPWLYKITTRLGWSQRDTKEDEARDEDFDYEYWRYLTSTEHRINPELKTELKYQYFKKDYISADLDHRGFYIQNTWDYEILDDERQRLGLGFGLEHKDVDYTLKTSNNYKKETVELKANYQRKKNWKTSILWSENFYDFNDSSNDKKRYYAKLGLEKLFLAGDLVLSIDFKYRYTDYKQKDDSRTQGVRLAFKYKF